MAKRALLTGCNYPGSQHALKGCINDVWAIKDMLENCYAFASDDITVMIDTDSSYEQPTGGNIKRKLGELVAASEPGDTLVFHYSGHGTQVPAFLKSEERDFKDEALCPTDMNTISDDDLRKIFCNMKEGVKFTMIADCCHSGTLLDGKEVIISGPKSDDPEQPPQLVDTFTASLGGDNRDISNRALPTEDFLAALSAKVGYTITPDQLSGAMGQLFGSDASSKVMAVLDMVNQGMSKLQVAADGGSESGGRGLFGSLLGAAVGAVAEAVPELAAAGGGGSTQAQLPSHTGILITGCQSHETSADACPSGDPNKAYGALTNALTTVVKEYKASYPEQNISNRTLVSGVRSALVAGKFAQNPCLECSEQNADAPFIVA